MNERQTDKLLVKIAQGDKYALEELYEQTKRGVFAFLYSYLKNYESCEDVMQTVYLKIKINAEKYIPGTNGRAWILQIAKNLALDEIKKNSRTYIPDREQTYSLQNYYGVSEVMEKVLSSEEREIVILHVLWGYKHREIAAMLNCPTGTVTSKYKRSIKKLQTALKEVNA